MQMHISSPSERAAGAGGAAELPRGQANYFMSNLISGTQTSFPEICRGKKEPFCSPVKAAPHKEAEQE